MNNTNITASEIAEYVYCPRVWWLKHHTQFHDTTPQMLSGIKVHNALNAVLDFSWKLKLIGLLLIGISILLLVLVALYVF